MRDCHRIPGRNGGIPSIAQWNNTLCGTINGSVFRHMKVTGVTSYTTLLLVLIHWRTIHSSKACVKISFGQNFPEIDLIFFTETVNYLETVSTKLDMSVEVISVAISCVMLSVLSSTLYGKQSSLHHVRNHWQIKAFHLIAVTVDFLRSIFLRPKASGSWESVYMWSRQTTAACTESSWSLWQ